MIRPQDERNALIACTIEASDMKASLEPRQNDIVFGRGKKYQDHLGNIRMRECVKEYKNLYNVLKRFQKQTLVETIYQKLVDGGARFLRRDELTDTWVLVDREMATQKVSHALRCKKHLSKVPSSLSLRRAEHAFLPTRNPTFDKTTSKTNAESHAQILRSVSSMQRPTFAPSLQLERATPCDPFVGPNNASLQPGSNTLFALESLRIREMARRRQLLAMLEMERQVQADQVIYNVTLTQILRGPK